MSTAKELQQTGKTSSFKSTSRPATTNSANKKMTELPETSTQASFTTSVNNLAPITASVNNLAPITTSVNNFSQKHTTGDILTTHYRNNVHLSSKTKIESTTHTNIVVSIRSNTNIVSNRNNSPKPTLPPDLSKNHSCSNQYDKSSMTKEGKIFIVYICI